MKKQTKHEKIIALYKEGMKPKDIAAKLKIKTQTVYAATCKYRKDEQKAIYKVIEDNNIKDCMNQYNKSLEKQIELLNAPIEKITLDDLKNETLFTKIKRFLFGA